MLNRLALGIGRGILAGAAGTAAMTLSSTLEAKLRGRPYSTAPAKAAARALGIETFDDGEAYARFSNLVHWGYGTGWGVARGMLRASGVRPRLATAGRSVPLMIKYLVSLERQQVFDLERGGESFAALGGFPGGGTWRRCGRRGGASGGDGRRLMGDGRRLTRRGYRVASRAARHRVWARTVARMSQPRATSESRAPP